MEQTRFLLLEILPMKTLLGQESGGLLDTRHVVVLFDDGFDRRAWAPLVFAFSVPMLPQLFLNCSVAGTQ